MSETKKDIRVGAITLIDDLEFVLVQSKKGKWIFPKGAVKEKETEEMACIREAFEEAGVVGDLESELFCVRKNINFYILKVEQLFEKYPESEQRKRRIMKIEDAMYDENVAEYVKEVIVDYFKERETYENKIFNLL